jgi:hypothetical protein
MHCLGRRYYFRQALMTLVNQTNGSSLQPNPFLSLIAFSQVFVLPGANNGEPRWEGQGLLATGQRNVHPPLVKLEWNGADGAHTIDQQQRGVPGPICKSKTAYAITFMYTCSYSSTSPITLSSRCQQPTCLFSRPDAGLPEEFVSALFLRTRSSTFRLALNGPRTQNAWVMMHVLEWEEQHCNIEQPAASCRSRSGNWTFNETEVVLISMCLIQ